MNKQMIEKMYAEKKAYVEETLKNALKPMDDFGNIQYARDVITNEEYVKLVEADGYPWYVNVTGNSLGAIAQEVAAMVCHQTPGGLVRGRAKQVEINKMFGGK